MRDWIPDGTSRAWWTAGILLVTVATVVKLFSPTIADPDLWGHVLYGQLARAVGWIPGHDPYSYLTAGRDWINHEWLTEHLFALAFDAWGPAGLIGVKLAASVSIATLLVWHLAREGLGLLRAAVFVLVLTIPLLLGLRTVRPHQFTYVFFTIVLLVLVHAESGRGKLLLLLPPVVAAWTNMHGGVLAGIGVIGIWVAVRLGRSLVARLRSLPPPPPPSPWIWMAALGASCLATLLNPYGWELVDFLITTATVPRPYITEWQPVLLRSERGILWLAGSLLTSWAILRCDDRPGPEALVVLGVLILLPLTAVRHLALTFLAIPILGGSAFASLWGREDRSERLPVRRAGPVGAGMCVVAMLVLTTAAEDLGCIEINPEMEVEYPARATAWLQDSGLHLRLAGFFDYGQYLIWHLGPRARVGMDGRRETVYPDSVYDAYMRFQHGRGDWSSYLSMGGPDVVLLPVGIPADNLVSLHPEWSSVYRDSLVRVYARRDSETAERLAAVPTPDLPPDGEDLCFP